MSLLAATWMSAVATVLLFIGAVFTVFYARNAYREQCRQTGLLREQADRDISQRRRAQASQVFAWVENRPFDGNDEDLRAAACIKNTSGQPVYDVVLGLGPGAGKGSARWPVLMPGAEKERRGLGTGFAVDQRPGWPIWIKFRDSAGVRWQATSDGQLTELTGHFP
jgi:hypothetical protein